VIIVSYVDAAHLGGGPGEANGGRRERLTEGHKYLKSHPLVVTHDDYVRADVSVELSTDNVEADVMVTLNRAARIDVTVSG
jgi:hypothetical protein